MKTLYAASVTLAAIRNHEPCTDSWAQLLRHVGKTKADDTPVPLLTILDLLGLDDALWALRALPPEYAPACRLLACDFAESVLHLVPEGEDRPRRAIETARRYAHGAATDRDLFAARDAARDAAWAAAWDAAGAPARQAAWDAATEAAREAAWDAARAAKNAARPAAEPAACLAAGEAARAAARDAQATHLRTLLTTTPEN